MRRIRFVPIAVLLLGFLGAFVRHVELKTAFDLSGLPRRGAAASVALILLTVLAAAIALALCLAARRYEAEGIYKRAFPIEGYGLFAVKALAGIAVTVCAPLLFLRPGTELMGLEGGARWPFVILMALAGFGMTVMAYAAYTRKNTAYLRPGSVMPALLCCYWMVACYRENAGNPILMEYGCRCLAMAAGSVSAFSRAGYAFGRRNLPGTLFLSAASVFLLPVAAADPGPLALRAPMVLYAVYIALDLVSLLSAAKPKEAEDKA